MASDAVIVLKQLLPDSSFGANWFAVRGGGAAGVNRGRVNNEGDAKRAKYGSIINVAVSPKKGKSR